METVTWPRALHIYTSLTASVNISTKNFAIWGGSNKTFVRDEVQAAGLNFHILSTLLPIFNVTLPSSVFVISPPTNLSWYLLHWSIISHYVPLCPLPAVVNLLFVNASVSCQIWSWLICHSVLLATMHCQIAHEQQPLLLQLLYKKVSCLAETADKQWVWDQQFLWLWNSGNHVKRVQ